MGAFSYGDMTREDAMSAAITGNKILSHIDRIVNNQVPITADVFLNNYCNNACPYCTYRRWEFDDGARYMPFENFVKYAKRLKDLGVLGMILSGGGEPSISKDFDRITRWLDENYYPYGINTNFNRFFDCCPNYLKVSLDGWDEDSYERARGVRHYQLVRENIMQFAEGMTIKTNLGIQLLATERDQVYRFYEANADLPVDYIVMRPVESTSGSYYRNLPADRNFFPREIIKAIKDVAQTDDRIVMNYKWNLLDRKYNHCIGEWSQIALNELGEVIYCCHKPYQVIGHIMDEDILEKKRKAVTDMDLCDIPCRLSGVNHDLTIINRDRMDPEFI